MQNKIKIAPSILSANFAKLGEEIVAITKAGADYIHIDVMDGNFVPNITIGPMIIKSVRKESTLPFDVHLMIANPDLYISEFANAGADIITVHAEACVHLSRTIQIIKSYDKKAAVAIVPTTNENILDYILDEIDLVLVMTVNPGFGGQKFIYNQLKKIEAIANKIAIKNTNIDLEVDGGINQQTAKDVINAGANVLVAGSAIFTGDAKKYASNILSLRL